MTTRMEMISVVTFLCLVMNVDNYMHSLCEISHSHSGGGYEDRAFLGAFAKLRKASFSGVMSVRRHGTTRLPLDEFT